MVEFDKRNVAASAELIQERLQNRHVGDAPDDGSEVAVGEGVVESLRRHVDDQLTDVGRYAAFERWPSDESLPTWVSEFSEMLDEVLQTENPETVSTTAPDVPFVHVLQPFVDYNYERIADALDTEYLTDEAISDLKTYLLDRFVEVSAQALHIDFVSYVAENDPTVIEEGRRSPDSTEWYREYVSDFFQTRAPPFFEEYPVLARLLSIVATEWRDMVSEFAERLRTDYDSVVSLLGIDGPERAVGVEPLGDAHENGRSVLMIEFESGAELVYKPRDLEPERELYDFVSWLSSSVDGFPSLDRPDLLSKENHGWVEKVEPASFSEVEEVERHYRRCGALLCVLYVLNTTDCHYSNLVASSPSPVIVDAETILDQGKPVGEVPRSIFNKRVQNHVIKSTVLGTAMLPFTTKDMDFTKSALGAIEERNAQLLDVTWKHVNTDAIDLEYHRSTYKPEHNFPRYDGEPVRPAEFVDEIANGFDAAYDSILDAVETVEARVVEQFGGVRNRTLLVNTAVYDGLLNTLTNPEYLRSGVEYGCKIQETLRQRLGSLSDDEKRRWSDLLRAEVEAVTRRDIPKFMARTDDNGIYFNGEKVYEPDSEKTGIERVRSRIRSLSEDDRRFQTGLIRAGLDDVPVPEGGYPHDSL